MDEKQLDKSLLVELDMPSGVAPARLTTSWRIGKKGLTFHFELFGRFIETAAAENIVGLLSRVHSKHQSKHGSVFQVWQQTVTCEDSSVYGELRWHPDHGERFTIRGIEQETRKEDIDRIWDGMQLFPLVRDRLHWEESQVQEFVPLGRPRGAVLTQRSFIHFAVEAYKKLFEQGYKQPSQESVAVELQISRITVIRNLKRYGIAWGDIRKKALRDIF